jgi:hypothetical protein
VSKGSRINVNFADFWSGRWESNPRPKLHKLLNILASLPLSASNCVQLQGI